MTWVRVKKHNGRQKGWYGGGFGASGGGILNTSSDGHGAGNDPVLQHDADHQEDEV